MTAIFLNRPDLRFTETSEEEVQEFEAVSGDDEHLPGGETDFFDFVHRLEAGHRQAAPKCVEPTCLCDSHSSLRGRKPSFRLAVAFPAPRNCVA